MRVARDIVLLLVGAAIGYIMAISGRLHLPPDLFRRAEAYYRAHSIEVLIWGVLIAIILYLLAGRQKGAKGRR
jgi:hypothetical protein